MDLQSPRARTILHDVARLIKQNKISKEDLARMSKAFRQEAMDYAAQLPEEEIVTEISVKPKQDKSNWPLGYTPTNRPSSGNSLSAAENIKAAFAPRTPTQKPAAAPSASASKTAPAAQQPININVNFSSDKPVQPEQSTITFVKPMPAAAAPDPVPAPKAKVPEQPPVKESVAWTVNPSSKTAPSPAPAPKAEVAPAPKPESAPVPVPKKVPNHPVSAVIHTARAASPSQSFPKKQESVIKPQLNAKAMLMVEEEALNKEKEKIESKKAEISEAIQALVLQKGHLASELEGIKSREKSIEEDEKEVAKEAGQASSTSLKKSLEEKRWELEDKRQEVEKERFSLHEKSEALDQQIADMRKEESAVDVEMKRNERALEHVHLRKEAQVAEEKKDAEEKIYAAIQSKKVKYESDWVKMKEDLKHLEGQMSLLDDKLSAAKKEFEEIESAEKSTSSEKERHALEEKRWNIDKKLRALEKEGWGIEELVEKKSAEVSEIEKTFEAIQMEEAESKGRLNEYKAVIRKAREI